MDSRAEQIRERFGRYPTLIVGTYLRAANEASRGGAAAEERLVQATFEACLKYVVAVLVAEYREAGLAVEKVDIELAKLARPSLGTYAALLRNLLAVPEIERSPFRETIATWNHTRISDQPHGFRASIVYLSSAVEFPRPKPEATFRYVVDLLVRYRNMGAHGAVVEGTDLERNIEALYDILDVVFERLRPLGEMRLFACDSTHSDGVATTHDLIVWRGETPLRSTERLGADLEPGGTYIADAEGAKGRYLDLRPLCASLRTSNAAAGEHQLYLFNGATRTRLKFISPVGNNRVIESQHDEYPGLRGRYEALTAATADRPHDAERIRELLTVSDLSEKNYNEAMAILQEGQIDVGENLLEMAIRLGPGHRDAVIELTDLYCGDVEYRAAHGKLESYLALVPHDVELLLWDAELLHGLGRADDAESRLKEILAQDPENALAVQYSTVPPTTPSRRGHALTEETPRLTEVAPLPQEALMRLLVGRLIDLERWGHRLQGGMIGAATALTAAVFYTSGDAIMTMASLSLGVLWTASTWSTYRTRRLVVESRRNFVAFLRSHRGRRPEGMFDEFQRRVLGDFTTSERGASGLADLCRRNVLALGAPLVVGTVLTGSLFEITMYPPFPVVVDAVYFLFLWLVCVQFAQVLTVALAFQMSVHKLSKERIHFSLVQHPKLSIRYLCLLSRRLAYPLLALSTMATFTLYLGPFRGNIVFVLLVVGLLAWVCAAYYNTILLVRKVIIENKWRLIAQFSAHFDEPFNRIVREADETQMNRVKELIEMRDFIDSMEVWAEKRPVLLGTTLLYLAVMVGASIGMSNLMTRHVMPSFSQAAHDTNVGAEPATVPLPADGLIHVEVEGVDDMVMIAWADTLADLLDHQLYGIGEQARATVTRPNGSGFVRCDWDDGEHGAIEGVSFPVDSTRHVLVAAYNKVYRGYLLMGGGKLSYDILLRAGDHPVLNRAIYVRHNTRWLGYLEYLRIERSGDDFVIERHEGVHEVEVVLQRSGGAVKFVEWFEAQLGSEDAAVMSFMRGVSEQAPTGEPR